ncbi:MAG: glycosyltransferase family 4 protein [Acidimicrobiales bacterium]
MRILLVHRYFWPDVPTYAQMLRYVGEHLASEGHDVTVFCGPPTYNDAYQGPPRPPHETVGGVKIIRVDLPPDHKQRPILRAFSMLTFAARLVVHAVGHRPRYDLLTVTTIPPIIMGAAARMIRRLTGTPYLYHCMDLYPEVAELAGIVRRPLVARVARRMDTTTCRRAAAVVVLSDDMRTTVGERGIDTANVQVVNNFEIEDVAVPVPASTQLKAPRTYRVLFAGNIGRFQGLDQLVDAVGELAPEHPELELLFVGSGSDVNALKERAGRYPRGVIRFLDHQPLEAVLRLMEDADLAVVSLMPGIYRVAYPSKAMMYLKSGCRMLVVVEPESELGRFVIEEELGVVCPPGDGDALVKALRRELEAGPPGEVERARARAACEHWFGRSAVLGRWSELLLEIGKERVGG